MQLYNAAGKVCKTLDQVFDFKPFLILIGLGCHGLTPDVTGLTNLHAALKTELQRHIDAYKTALHRLEELGLGSTDAKKPVDASHQRLLSLHHEEVQQRLIDNKTLLTILDKPALQQLRPLIDTLAMRVQNDKEALFCVSQLKRCLLLETEFVLCAELKQWRNKVLWPHCNSVLLLILQKCYGILNSQVIFVGSIMFHIDIL